jgi:hypothetical protein
MAFPPKKSKKSNQASNEAYETQLHNARENSPPVESSPEPETQVVGEQVSHEPKPSGKKRRNNPNNSFVRKNG